MKLSKTEMEIERIQNKKIFLLIYHKLTALKQQVFIIFRF